MAAMNADRRFSNWPLTQPITLASKTLTRQCRMLTEVILEDQKIPPETASELGPQPH